MNWTLAKLLGLDPSKLEGVPLEKLTLRFVGLPHSWWALLCIAVIAAFVWLSFRTYKREGRQATPRLKNFLACLRLGAILLALFVLFQPTLVIDQSRPLRSALFMLVDTSLSMGIQDKIADPKTSEDLAKSLGIEPTSKLQQMSRLDIVRHVLERDKSAVLAELSQIYDLKLIPFSDSLAPELPLRAGEPKSNVPAAEQKPPTEQEPFVLNLATLTATGQSTNLELAVRSALTQARGQPVKAIVVLTDGQANAGDTLAGARSANQKGVEVYTSGFGDPSDPKNIEVSNVVAPNVAFKEDELIITVTLNQHGFKGKQVAIQLKESSKTGEAGRVVLTKNSDPLPDDGRPMTVSLKFKPETLGVMTYKVEIPVQPGETIEADNVASTVVRVVDQKAQILFVSGSPGKEYRYLKNFLIRDTTMQTQCWLQHADPQFNQECSKDLKPLEKMPQDEQELFKYDVIILLDPDPAQFTPHWADLIRRFVGEHGGGLVYVAGNIYTEDLFASRELSPLADLMPVEVGKQGLTFQERLERTWESASPLVLTPQGWDNPMFKLDNDEALNKKLWGEPPIGGDMPGIFWSQAVFASKPGGIALAVHSDPRRRIKEGPQPLVSMQFYGVGRTVFVGFNSTWRWRYVDQGKYFNQFWGQAVRFVSQGRLLGGRKRILVFTDKDTYTVGQQVEVTIRMLEADYEHPMLKPEVTAVVKAETGALSELKLLPDVTREGDYRGSFVAVKPGLLDIAPKIFDPDLADKMANKIVHVTLPRLEFKETRMNEPLLKQVAALTHAKYLRPSEFDELRRLLPTTPILLMNEEPLSLWDAPLILVLFCLLLFTEWIIRKMKNMA